jgi:hypothetical protein
MPAKIDMTSEKNDPMKTKKASSQRMQEGVEVMVGQLTDGLKSCLEDIWCLEINTMVVSDIGGHRFNPFHCYESFCLLPDNLDQFKEMLGLKAYAALVQGSTVSDEVNLKKQLLGSRLPTYVKKVFCDRMFPQKADSQGDQYRENVENLESTMRKYILLKDRLLLAFKSCVIKEEIEIPSSESEASVTSAQTAKASAAQSAADRLPLEKTGAQVEALALPSLDVAISIRLLDNSYFLRELRSLRELYYLVGGQDAADSTNVIDLIAAQTVIQMDGDVMSRFHKALLGDSNKDFLLQTHEKALLTGQENWKNLVSLIIESIKSLSRFFESPFP